MADNGKRYFGTDGIRGPVGLPPIDAAFVLRLAHAAGTAIRGQRNARVLIGKDTRISGYMFESALEAGFIAAGIHVALLGPLPTPGVAYLTRTFHTALGIVITASHNPYTDNGLKFFNHRGIKISDDLEKTIETLLHDSFSTVPAHALGKAERINDAAGRYIEHCKSTLPLDFGLEGMKIVVDCAHGATYHVAPEVFTELGAKVYAINVEPDGFNINHNAGTLHPDSAITKVREVGADLGITFDGDGDRVLLIDSSGHLYTGDHILYLLAKHWQRLGRLTCPIVVGTQMTNNAVEKALAALQITLIRTAVGDRYVREGIVAHNAMLGGEPSGHVVCADRTTTGDGIICALQVLEIMRTTGQSLATLTEALTLCPQALANITISNTDMATVLQDDAYRQTLADCERAVGDGRILVRPSGTEPVIRILVESRDSTVNEHIVNELSNAVSAACRRHAH